MSVFSATDPDINLGELLDLAQQEPVHVQKNGRDVAVVLSAAEYQRLVEASARLGVNPRLEALHRESVAEWDAVYKALAK